MWHYIVRPCRNTALGWVAFAKRGPFITDGDFVREPGELWFQCGATEAEARAKIEAETRALSH